MAETPSLMSRKQATEVQHIIPFFLHTAQLSDWRTLLHKEDDVGLLTLKYTAQNIQKTQNQDCKALVHLHMERTVEIRQPPLAHLLHGTWGSKAGGELWHCTVGTALEEGRGTETNQRAEGI